MPTMQLLNFGYVVTNSTAFIVAAKYLFKSDKASTSAYSFMFSFLVILWLTLAYLYCYPTNDQNLLILSLTMCFASSGIFIWAASAIRKRPFSVIFSPDTPEYLNQSGPYLYIRHPFYTAYLLNFAAAAVSSDHFAPKLTLIAIFTIYLIGAKKEESKFNNSTLRDDYLQYKQKTGMFLPKMIWSRK